MEITAHKWIKVPWLDPEVWKIVSEDKYVGNEDDGYEREWIATVYDEAIADYIIAMHNYSVMYGHV